MSNKPFPDLPKDKVLQYYAAYTILSDRVWLIRDSKLWALYAPDDAVFLSPLMYSEFEHPADKNENLCNLFTSDKVVRFDLEKRCCSL